jgi:hypothetical protein
LLLFSFTLFPFLISKDVQHTLKEKTRLSKGKRMINCPSLLSMPPYTTLYDATKASTFVHLAHQMDYNKIIDFTLSPNFQTSSGVPPCLLLDR